MGSGKCKGGPPQYGYVLVYVVYWQTKKLAMPLFEVEAWTTNHMQSAAVVTTTLIFCPRPPPAALVSLRGHL